jgi:hypothetical protein
MMALPGPRPWFLILLLIPSLFTVPPLANAGEAETLEVQPDPNGGLHATATLHLPVPPAVVQQVLTDYERWGSLFGVPMRLLRVERLPDRVVTDVYLSHPILPGESRLLCESRELPGGGLVTTLIEGDFKRYQRKWILSQDEDGTSTKAQFDLVVEVETWAPDWLIALELKRQLTKHFGILRETVAARSAAH